MLLGPNPHLCFICGDRRSALFGVRVRPGSPVYRADADRAPTLHLTAEGAFSLVVEGHGVATGELSGVGDPLARPDVVRMQASSPELWDAMRELEEYGELVAAARELADLPDRFVTASDLAEL